MCTVSFIPGSQSVLIAHSRDEKSTRGRAFPPRLYELNGTRLLFPRDTTAGGTWVALNDRGDAAALLNGAYHNHIPAPPYRKSRGIVFLDIFSAPDPVQHFQQMDLAGIEPFTLVIWSRETLYDCRWDGTEKHLNRPDPAKPHIWASVTLYNKTIYAKRERWFNQWLQQQPALAPDTLLDFHLNAGEGDPETDLKMNLDDELFTVSITVMQLGSGKAAMEYLDTRDDHRSLLELPIFQPAVLVP